MEREEGAGVLNSQVWGGGACALGNVGRGIRPPTPAQRSFLRPRASRSPRRPRSAPDQAPPTFYTVGLGPREIEAKVLEETRDLCGDGAAKERDWAPRVRDARPPGGARGPERGGDPERVSESIATSWRILLTDRVASDT